MLRWVMRSDGRATAELERIKALPPRVRKRMVALVARRPKGCAVVTVYHTHGRLLVELRGEVKVSGDTFVGDLRPGDVVRGTPDGSWLPHAARWLDGAAGRHV